MNQPNDSLLPAKILDQSFLDKIDAVGQAIIERHKELSQKPTPRNKVKARYQSYINDAGGLDVASEPQGQAWLVQMRRRMKIPDGPLEGKVVENG